MKLEFSFRCEKTLRLFLSWLKYTFKTSPFPL